MINPGIPYVSTSQPEVFERRNLLNLKESLSKQNPFIAAPENDDVVSRYEGKQEESYIAPVHDPYQLKTIYQVKNVEEIEFDSDDEDALILQQQPFETIQQTGFFDYLTQLNTKFIARRSDIIVSSTLSITLTPEDDGFVPLSLYDANYDKIWEYCMLRQEYRSFSISSNILPKGAGANFYDSTNESFVVEFKNPFSEGSLGQDYFDENQDLQPGESNKKMDHIDQCEKLPPTLLSEPLDSRAVLRLVEKDQRKYKQQKAKYESTKKTNSKKDVKPSDVVFALEDARLLLAGLYHKDEDEDGVEIVDHKVDGEGV